MWTCPKCKARFVQPNMWHSCGNFTVESFLEGKSVRAISLFWHFVDEYRKIGFLTLHPVKTRVALMVKVRFCAINRLSTDHIQGSLWLKQRVESDKFFKIEQYTEHDFGHYFKIYDESDIDNEFRNYMTMAYAIGKRKHIKSNRQFF